MSSDHQKLDHCHMIPYYHKRSILGQPEGRAVLKGDDFGLETLQVDDSVVFSKLNECVHELCGARGSMVENFLRVWANPGFNS